MDPSDQLLQLVRPFDSETHVQLWPKRFHRTSCQSYFSYLILFLAPTKMFLIKRGEKMNCHDAIIIATSQIFLVQNLFFSFFRNVRFRSEKARIINLVSNTEWQQDVTNDKEVIRQIFHQSGGVEKKLNFFVNYSVCEKNLPDADNRSKSF